MKSKMKFFKFRFILFALALVAAVACSDSDEYDTYNELVVGDWTVGDQMKDGEVWSTDLTPTITMEIDADSVYYVAKVGSNTSFTARWWIEERKFYARNEDYYIDVTISKLNDQQFWWDYTNVYDERCRDKFNRD